MTAFLETLTHQRKLQAATTELSLEQLEDVNVKLSNIIEKKRKKIEEQELAKEEKKAKVQSILSLLDDEGLTLDDVNEAVVSSKSVKTQQKRPVKYVLLDNEGNEHTWTGIGRMPKVYKEALESGKSLDDYSVGQ